MNNTPKLFISPVNSPILKAIINSNLPIGFIFSQRQFNNKGGYVNSSIIEEAINSNLVIERDHFCINEFDEQVIEFDSQKFNMVHIDPWYYTKAINHDYIKWIHSFLKYNPRLTFEFGTEDFIQQLSVFEYKKALDDLAPFADSLTYLVCQGGSVVFDCKNISPIDVNKTKNFVSLGNEYNLKIKRHNCDFHTNEELKLLRDLGVSSYNFAPEFTYISNSVIYDNLKSLDKNYFACLIAEKTPWERWLHNLNDREKTLKACLHYLDYDSNMQDYVNKYEEKIIELVGERLQEICQIV